jgi:hypothetical protein
VNSSLHQSLSTSARSFLNIISIVHARFELSVAASDLQVRVSCSHDEFDQNPRISFLMNVLTDMLEICDIGARVLQEIVDNALSTTAEPDWDSDESEFSSIGPPQIASENVCLVESSSVLIKPQFTVYRSDQASFLTIAVTTATTDTVSRLVPAELSRPVAATSENSARSPIHQTSRPVSVSSSTRSTGIHKRESNSRSRTRRARALYPYQEYQLSSITITPPTETTSLQSQA